MRRPRKEIEIFSLSFLDVICCGFGAVILLLVISLGFEPATVQKMTIDLRDDIQSSEESRALLVEQS